MKYAIFLTFFFFLQSTYPVLSFAAQKERIKVIRNSRIFTNILKVRDENGVDYFALKDLAEICSGQLFWHRVSRKAVVKINNQPLAFFYDSKKVYVNDKKIFLDYPSVIISNRIHIPFDFLFTEDFSKISGQEVSYDEDTHILTFRKKANVLQPMVYNEPDLAKIKIEMTEILPYDLEKIGAKEYLVTFYRGKTISEKINFDNSLVRNVTMDNTPRKALYKIFLTKNNLEVRKRLVDHQLFIFIYPREKAEYVEKVIKSTQIIPAEGRIAGKKRTFKGGLTVVIDPGHGGKDPGCIGRNGTKEKTLTLKIAKGLTKLLKGDGHKVFLTRSGDTFMPLVERTDFANKKNADVFISIHCNSSLKETSEGFEIYFLSEKASDPEAEATAALENSVIKLEGEPNRKQKALQELLWSMTVNEFINDSSELCSFISGNIIGKVRIEKRGIKQAGFHVLRGAQMPAVLVECGFLSNPREEAKLRSRRFQRQIIDGIYSGIRKYENWK